MPLMIGKGAAVNLLTVVVSAVLTLRLHPALGDSMQAQNSGSQPVDPVKGMKVTGAVQKVDANKHVMTKKLENGKKQTLKVDKSVTGLDQFKTGDRVQLSYTQQIMRWRNPPMKARAGWQSTARLTIGPFPHQLNCLNKKFRYYERLPRPAPAIPEETAKRPYVRRRNPEEEQARVAIG